MVVAYETGAECRGKPVTKKAFRQVLGEMAEYESEIGPSRNELTYPEIFSKGSVYVFHSLQSVLDHVETAKETEAVGALEAGKQPRVDLESKRKEESETESQAESVPASSYGSVERSLPRFKAKEMVTAWKDKQQSSLHRFI